MFGSVKWVTTASINKHHRAVAAHLSESSCFSFRIRTLNFVFFSIYTFLPDVSDIRSLTFNLASKEPSRWGSNKRNASSTYVISVTVTTRSSLHRKTPFHARCSQCSAFQTPSTATQCIIFLVVIRCLVHMNPSPDASRIYVGGMQSLHRSRRSVL